MSFRSFIVASVLAGLLFSTQLALAKTQPQKVKVNLPQDRTLTVRDAPAGTKVGSQRGGNEGTLVGSVQTAGGRTWQQVNFDSDPDGFVASEFLVTVGQQVAVDCPQGELPTLDSFGDDVWGRDWVPIGDGETHTYCFTLRSFSRKLQMAVVDRTGVNQCSWNTVEFIPPENSGLKKEVGTGLTNGYSFFNASGLPRETWRIRITEAITPNCNDKYLVVVHP